MPGNSQISIFAQGIYLQHLPSKSLSTDLKVVAGPSQIGGGEGEGGSSPLVQQPTSLQLGVPIHHGYQRHRCDKAARVL